MIAASLDEPAASLVARHQRLAARNIEGAATAEDRANLVADIVAAGAATPAGPARDVLRDILYFWAGEQASRGEWSRTAPPPTLAPYASAPKAAPEPAAGAVASAVKDAIDAGLADQTLTLSTTGGVSGAINVLKHLAHRATTTGSPPAGDTAAPVTDVEKEARARAIVRIAALGRQWRVTADPEVKRGYLLTGKALLEAALYADEDPDISDLVKASQKDADAARRLRRIAWALAGAVAVAAVGGYLFLYLSAKAAAERQQQAFNRARAESLFAENKKLQQANAATTLEKDQFKSSAQKAVDAIGHDDLTPLKQFLQRFGDADPKQLDRLVLSAPTATSIEATSAKAPVADRRILASAQAYAPTEATCAGYLWFGSAQDSRLSDRRDPTTLKAGDTVTLDTRADIRMRSDWPAPETYAMSPQTGLAPGGSTVKLTGDIRQYARGAQQQVWGQITAPRAFCTTVFLQYVGAPDRRDAALAALRSIAVQTPPAEQLASAKGLAEVRYFWPEDKAVAEQTATALGPFAPGGKIKVVALTDFPTRPSSGTIEAWLDLSR